MMRGYYIFTAYDTVAGICWRVFRRASKQSNPKTKIRELDSWESWWPTCTSPALNLETIWEGGGKEKTRPLCCVLDRFKSTARKSSGQKISALILIWHAWQDVTLRPFLSPTQCYTINRFKEATKKVLLVAQSINMIDPCTLI